MKGGSYDRRTILQTVGGLGVTSILIADRVRGQVSSNQETDGWLQDGYDAAGSYNNPNTTGPRDGARARWRRNFNSIGSPVVTDGHVYFPAEHDLVALDADTGQQVWSTEVGYTDSSPAVSNDSVMVGTHEGLYGLNRSNGGIQWSVNGDSGDASVTIADGTIYSVIDDNVSAVSLDGTIQWQHSLEQGLKNKSDLIASTDQVFFIDGNEVLTAVSADSGGVLWTQDSNAFTQGIGLSRDGQTVYWNIRSRSVGGVQAIDAVTGMVRWTSDESVGPKIMVTEDMIIGTQGAIDTSSGHKISSWRIGSWHPNTAIKSQNTIYQSTVAGWVKAYDIQRNEQLWRYSVVGEGGQNKMAVVNGTLYVPTNSGYLYALESAPDSNPPDITLRVDGEVVEHRQRNDSHEYGELVVENGTELTFDASNSVDSDGTVERYEWTNLKRKIATGPRISKEYTVPSKWPNSIDLFHLTVTDSDGLTAGREVAIRNAVQAEIQSPSNTLESGDTVEFSAETDSVRSISEYRWDFGDDGSTNITTETETVQWQFTTTGSVPVALTVVDTEGYQITVSEEIQVQGDPLPRPAISLGTEMPVVGREVALSASNTTVPAGAPSVQKYEWAFGSNASFTTSGEEITHTFNDIGSQTIRLRLTVSEEKTVLQRREVEIVPPESIEINYTPASPTVGQLLTCQIKDPVSAEGYTYKWAFGIDAEFTTSGQGAEHIYTEPGNYVVRLRLTNPEGTTVTSTTTEIEVAARPSPTIEVDQSSPTTGQEITFDASNSAVGDNRTVKSYEWGFGSDAEFSTTGQQVTHTFTEANTHTVRLRITDSSGVSEITNVSVTVQQPPLTASDGTDGENDLTNVDPAMVAGGTAVSLGMVGAGVGAYRYTRSDTDPGITTVNGLTRWPQYGRDAGRARAAPNNCAPLDDPSQVWHRNDGPTSGAIVDTNRVYCTSGEILRTYTLADGDREWQVFLGDEEDNNCVAVTGPALTGETVIVGANKNLRAFDVTDGQTAWVTTLDAKVLTPPLVANNTCYIGTTDGVTAVDAKTGTEHFHREGLIASGLAATRDSLYVAENSVTCLDSATGEARWKFDLGCGDDVSIAAADDRVYVAGMDAVVCLDPKNGRTLWRNEKGVSVHGLAVADDTVIVIGSNVVLAYSTRTGDQVWSCPRNAKTPPIRVGGVVYVCTENALLAIDAESGTERWDIMTEAPPQASPTPVGNVILVATNDGLEAIQADVSETSGSIGGRKTVHTQTNGIVNESRTEYTPEEFISEVETKANSVETDRLQEGPLVRSTAVRMQEQGTVRVLTLAPELTVTDKLKNVFREHVQAWRNVTTHPNVVTIHDWGTDPRPWVVLETVDGITLDEFPAGLTMTETIQVLQDVAEATRNARLYNVTHNGLTPERIWVAGYDDGISAQVDDWGLERALRIETNDIRLTAYTAPEQADGDGYLGDARTDVYALGAVAYYSLTGEPPTRSTEDMIRTDSVMPPSTLADMPSAIDDVLLQALATDPDDRYTSTYEFTQSLEDAL